MTIEVTAKKLQDAINQGLEQLGATLDEVDVQVIEQGGLFKKAKVKLTLEREAAPTPEQQPVVPSTPEKKPEPATAKKSESTAATPADKPSQPKAQPQKQKTPPQKQQTKKSEHKPQQQPSDVTDAEHKQQSEPQKQEPKQPRKLSEEDKLAAAHALEFVKDVIQKMGFSETQIVADESGEQITVTANNGDDSLIIGRHGETLSALSYLAETCARAEKSHVNITVDCNGYRDRRAATLAAMAKRRANECVQKHRKIKLEPMERIDRRTVHNALTADNRVTTSSEGKEPHRYVVIIPKNN